MAANLGAMNPSLDDESAQKLAWALKHSASPGTVDAIHQMNSDFDVRPILPSVRVPTLVLARTMASERFEPRGVRELKGLGDWPLYSVTQISTR